MMISTRPAPALPPVAHVRRTTLLPRSSIGGPGWLATTFAASLSTGAAAIHVAVASSHLEPLGDLALGFYWAAIFQAAFAVALVARPRSGKLVRTGVAINLALIGAWAWSRTIGLPTVAGGPESVGVADATAVAFQIVLVALLASRLAGPGTTPGRGRPAAGVRAIVRSVFVAGIGIVALSTSIAVNDGLTGHGRHGAAPYARPDSKPALIQPGRSEAPHGHGAATAH